MSEAVELYKQDGTASGVFYCSECRAVFPNKEQAAGCHGERICACGKKIERRYYAICDDCQSKKWREESDAKERYRFEKATKISEAEYKGDKVFDGEFYDSVEDAIDKYLEGQEPEYVWACKNRGVPKANSDGIIEHLLDGMWDEADSSDLNGLAELDAAIEQFNKANESIAVYVPDYSTAIMVNKGTHERTAF